MLFRYGLWIILLNPSISWKGEFTTLGRSRRWGFQGESFSRTSIKMPQWHLPVCRAKIGTFRSPKMRFSFQQGICILQERRRLDGWAGLCAVLWTCLIYGSCEILLNQDNSFRDYFGDISGSEGTFSAGTHATQALEFLLPSTRSFPIIPQQTLWEPRNKFTHPALEKRALNRPGLDAVESVLRFSLSSLEGTTLFPRYL